MELVEPVVDWNNVFTKIKYLGKLFEVLPFTAPELTLKLENAVKKILEQESKEVQKLVERNTLLHSGVKLEDMSIDEYKIEKNEIEMEFKTAGEQFNHGHEYDEKDNKKYFKWMKKAADKGHNKAQNNVAVCYMKGEGVEKDQKKANEWYMKSAVKGNLTSQYNLGDCYRCGLGVEIDEKKAFEWYMKSALQNHSGAQNKLGDCYTCGLGVEKDEKKGFEWYMKSALQNNLYAQFNLGFCYEHGIGIEKDKNLAIEWYIKSSNNGHTRAQINLERLLPK